MDATRQILHLELSRQRQPAHLLQSIDSLKIARDFIGNIPHDRDDAAIALAIIGLARNLGLEVVAEGVETEAQVRFLAANRCDYLQGFYFSHPLEAEAYARLELNWRAQPLAQSTAPAGGVQPFKHGRSCRGSGE